MQKKPVVPHRRPSLVFLFVLAVVSLIYTIIYGIVWVFNWVLRPGCPHPFNSVLGGNDGP